LSLKDLKVFVAIPSMGAFPLATVLSLLDVQDACFKFGIEVDFGVTSCSLVHHARTLLGNIFLEKKKDFNRIFWFDSDITCTPVDFMKVLTHSTKHDCVVGIYPRRADPPAYYIKITDPDKEPDADGLVEVDGCGLGFACITREAMQELADSRPKVKFFRDEPCPELFRCDNFEGEARGEDYAFWADMKELGYRIYADATITLGHVGNKIFQCHVWPSQK
jgi:hypothetical protein